MSDLSQLVGKTLAKVETIAWQSMRFTTDDGSVYEWFNDGGGERDLDLDYFGRLKDIVGAPVTKAGIAKGAAASWNEGGTYYEDYEIATETGWLGVNWKLVVDYGKPGPTSLRLKLRKIEVGE